MVLLLHDLFFLGIRLHIQAVYSILPLDKLLQDLLQIDNLSTRAARSHGAAAP